MKNALKLIVGFVLVVFTYQQATAQYSNKKIRPKYQSYTDSLKNHQYDYVFPIFGQKTYQKGFDIPFPAGIMANFICL